MAAASFVTTLGAAIGLAVGVDVFDHEAYALLQVYADAVVTPLMQWQAEGAQPKGKLAVQSGFSDELALLGVSTKQHTVQEQQSDAQPRPGARQARYRSRIRQSLDKALPVVERFQLGLPSHGQQLVNDSTLDADESKRGPSKGKRSVKELGPRARRARRRARSKERRSEEKASPATGETQPRQPAKEQRSLTRSAPSHEGPRSGRPPRPPKSRKGSLPRARKAIRRFIERPANASPGSTSKEQQPEVSTKEQGSITKSVFDATGAKSGGTPSSKTNFVAAADEYTAKLLAALKRVPRIEADRGLPWMAVEDLLRLHGMEKTFRLIEAGRIRSRATIAGGDLQYAVTSPQALVQNTTDVAVEEQFGEWMDRVQLEATFGPGRLTELASQGRIHTRPSNSGGMQYLVVGDKDGAAQKN